MGRDARARERFLEMSAVFLRRTQQNRNLIERDSVSSKRKNAPGDLNAFARRNPALFLGASVALGFALARVGKTAIERAADGESQEQYNPYSNTMPGL